jgi:Zn-dependent peptidase ImmA (M78 family)
MTPHLSRAFVFQCEEIALEVRDELALGSEDRLDPRALAEWLAIKVVSIEKYRELLPVEVRRLTRLDVKALSAITVFYGTECRILFNPVHSVEHQDESIGHELAHVLLEHHPTPLFDEAGNRRWSATEEAEADYLADALLVPSEGAVLVLATLDGDVAAAAKHFGVSPVLISRRASHAGIPIGVAAEAERAASTLMDLDLEDRSRFGRLSSLHATLDDDDGAQPQPSPAS